MSFFTNAINVLQTLVIALGGGLCVWGGINLLEGYGQDNPASKSQGIKQLMAGGGVALIGITLIPAVRSAVHHLMILQNRRGLSLDSGSPRKGGDLP